MAQLNFDARQVQPSAGFDPIPKGWYKVMAAESDMKPTTGGDGAYLEVQFVVLEGQYQNRRIFARFNVRNPTPKAVEIGLGQLSALAHAVNVLTVADSSQLHNIPLYIRVKIREDKTGNYDDQNEVTSYRNINDPPPNAGPVGHANPPAMYPAQPPAQGQPPQGWAPPAQQPQQFAPPQQPQQFAPPQQPAQQQWPQQQPQQPWAGQPPQQPVQPMQPPQQPAQQPQQPAPGAWTPPAGGQPWGQQPQQAPANPQAQPPAQPQPPHPAQAAVPPWQRPPQQQ